MDISLVPLDRLERLAARPAGVRPEDQIWEALRELGTTRMGQADLGDAVRLRWARLAATAVTLKYAHAHDDDARKHVDVVRLRAAAIKALGPGTGDPDRDPENLFRYLTEKCGMAYDEVATETSQWRELPRAEILRLRRIKNMLTAAQGVEQHLPSGSPAREAAEKWLALLPDLP
ncbi:hypothetical protein ABT026_20990 [Streptomyces sp. NPDC002734]|uniref:hypothetical protein n=1 Tax=Streptomyces sp. NPDC002734 TaxID=3154426 RepID=UPI003329A94E